MAYEPVLTKFVKEPNSFTLDFYKQKDLGYEALRKAVTTMQPSRKHHNGERYDAFISSSLSSGGSLTQPCSISLSFANR